MLSIIHASRSLRQGHQIGISKKLPFTILVNDPRLLDDTGPLKLYLNEIKNFVKASEITIQNEKVCFVTNLTRRGSFTPLFF